MCDLYLALYVFLYLYWQSDYQIMINFRMQPTTRMPMGGIK
jgi:hypothetical protein